MPFFAGVVDGGDGTDDDDTERCVVGHHPYS
jgi:hypothetical protein